MNTATKRKQLSGWQGDAALYELSKPIKYEDGETSFVIVSAANAYMTGMETYIFAADVDGEVKNWGELEGSFRGSGDHARALRGAGYEIEK